MADDGPMRSTANHFAEEDRRVIAAFARCEPKSFDEMYLRFSPLVRRIAGLEWGFANADDVVNEVMLRAWRSRARLFAPERAGASFVGWLVVTARKQALVFFLGPDEIRERKRERELAKTPEQRAARRARKAASMRRRRAAWDETRREQKRTEDRTRAASKYRPTAQLTVLEQEERRRVQREKNQRWRAKRKAAA
jgi:hypothetical protein